MPPESQPMTVDEFNDATSGFYELLHDGIALKLDRVIRLLEVQNQLLSEVRDAVAAQG
jgi:hypothetical protein